MTFPTNHLADMGNSSPYVSRAGQINPATGTIQLIFKIFFRTECRAKVSVVKLNIKNDIFVYVLDGSSYQLRLIFHFSPVERILIFLGVLGKPYFLGIFFLQIRWHSLIMSVAGERSPVVSKQYLST